MRILTLLQSTEQKIRANQAVTANLLHLDEKFFAATEHLMRYQVYDSLFGKVLLIVCEDRVFAMQFLTGSIKEHLQVFQNKYPLLEWEQSSQVDRFWKVFCEKKELPYLLVGSLFYFQVWEALIRIPEGGLVCYQFIAELIGRPTATRAVATAIGKNPVAWAIACHRVVSKNGSLGGYYYGLDIKKRLLAAESVLFIK